MSAKEAERYITIAEHNYHIFCILVGASSSKPGTNNADSEDTTDWQLTLLYYVLCIQLKALGSSRGQDLQDHYAIKCWINSAPDLTPIARSYRKAEEWSRDARYEGRHFGANEFRRYLKWFYDVHNHLGDLFEKAGITPPAAIAPRAVLGME